MSSDIKFTSLSFQNAMLNCWEESQDSARVTKTLPGKLHTKIHSPSNLYILLDFSLTVKAAPHEYVIRSSHL